MCQEKRKTYSKVVYVKAENEKKMPRRIKYGGMNEKMHVWNEEYHGRK